MSTPHKRLDWYSNMSVYDVKLVLFLFCFCCIVLFLLAIETTTQRITTNNEESLLKNNTLIFSIENSTILSAINEFQTTTIEIENTTVTSDIVHAIMCDFNEIPFIPNSVLIQPESNATYNVGTTLSFICQSGYESLFNQSSFVTCTQNGTWLIDTINVTMCQLSKLD